MSEMFDRLAKTVAGGVSRRDALKYLGGFLAGGFVTALAGRARADAGGGTNEAINDQCQKYCRACPSRPAATFGHCMSQCKQTLLTASRQNVTVATCGTCTATAPFTSAYTNTDVNNCGGCGTVCKGTTPGCCSGTCVDLDSDANNCGACGNVCSSGTCTGGNCA